MPEAHHHSPAKLNATLKTLAGKLIACHPKAVLLFGSAVGYMQDPGENPAPNDLDMLMVSDNPLLDIDLEGIDPPVELHRFRIHEVTAVARSLRYDTRAVAVSKLYTKNVAKQHARDVILASILLGPSYNHFGIEQIEINGLPDTRDYSRHLILHGHDWWQRLTHWARHRRTFLERMADKITSADRFD